LGEGRRGRREREIQELDYESDDDGWM